jgi:hypothetical protein
MNIMVIYPGRFHPFHLGHLASYDWLAKQYGADNVYIATSGVQDPKTSPFTYSDKVDMMTRLGVPASHVVKVKNPYQATEITSSLSNEEKSNTALIFAVSAKDAERFNFAPKKDGSPGYLQPMPPSTKGLAPMTKHGYVAVTPTVDFKVKGTSANSANQIRQLYLNGNDYDRLQIITDLYGAPDPKIKEIFDQRLGANQAESIVTYGAEIVDGGTHSAPMHEHRERLMKKITEIKAQLAHYRRLNLNEQHIVDYLDEKKSPDRKRN